MSIFNGKNNQSTFDSFYNRAVYDNTVYPEGYDGPLETTKFVVGEFKYYGRVDLDYTFVSPNEDELANHSTSGAQIHRNLPFVVDMWADLKTIMNRSVLLNCPLDFDIELIRTYESPLDDYDDYIRGVVDDYIQRALLETTTNLGNRFPRYSITDYSSFVKNFINFCEFEMQGKPITYSGWLASSEASIFNSGLAIQYYNVNHSVDQPKYDEIINTKTFEILKQVAKQVGFTIDFHNPTVLVADLSSPAMFPYYQRNNVASLENLFSLYYIKNNLYNINILYNVLLDKYNIFVNNYKYDKYFTDSCSGKTTEFIERKIEFNNEVENDIEYYCILKNIEYNNHYNTKQLNSLIKKSKKLQNKLDKSSAIGYTNSVFKEILLNKPFGFKDLQRREKQNSEFGGNNEQQTNTPSVSGY